MSSYSHTETTSENQSGGLLSRMFNALAPQGLKEWVAEIKESIADGKILQAQENRIDERHRQRKIDYAIERILQSDTGDTPEQIAKDIIRLNTKHGFHDFGKITVQDVLDKFDNMSEERKAELSQPRQEHATLEA